MIAVVLVAWCQAGVNEAWFIIVCISMEMFGCLVSFLKRSMFVFFHCKRRSKELGSDKMKRNKKTNRKAGKYRWM